MGVRLWKNKTSQKLAIWARDANYDGVIDDEANITAQISLNGAACAATDDTNPTPLDDANAPGVYIFDLTQAETNADMIVVYPASSTGTTIIEPVIIYTDRLPKASRSYTRK